MDEKRLSLPSVATSETLRVRSRYGVGVDKTSGFRSPGISCPLPGRLERVDLIQKGRPVLFTTTYGLYICTLNAPPESGKRLANRQHVNSSIEELSIHVVQLQLQLTAFLVPDLKAVFYLEVGMAIGIDDSIIAGLVD